MKYRIPKGSPIVRFDNGNVNVQMFTTTKDVVYESSDVLYVEMKGNEPEEYEFTLPPEAGPWKRITVDAQNVEIVNERKNWPFVHFDETCTECRTTYAELRLRDNASDTEYLISGRCQDCQDKSNK